MAISIEMIKKLREETSAGVMDCRNALEQADGDFDKALAILREKGLAMAAKRAEREASEGVVDLYSHGNGRVGVMVELNSETDFVGRSETFRKLAHELSLQIAAMSPKYIHEEDIPAEVIEEETQKAVAMAQEEKKPEAIIPRIVEGYLNKYKDENCLVRQTYIRDETITIQELVNQAVVSLGENIVIRRFVRWELGETSAQ